MKIYAVIRDCCEKQTYSIWDGPEAAEEERKRLAAAEHDQNVAWDVEEFTMNESYE
jgi:hypothetical protein